jgi:hypothetical protein
MIQALSVKINNRSVLLRLKRNPESELPYLKEIKKV